jgi:outer membrane murein-binding lipoprotein Lpp
MCLYLLWLIHVQEVTEECVTSQQLLIDHVKACCTKRASIRELAADVRKLQADVEALHAMLRARVADQQKQNLLQNRKRN